MSTKAAPKPKLYDTENQRAGRSGSRRCIAPGMSDQWHQSPRKARRLHLVKLAKARRGVVPKGDGRPFDPEPSRSVTPLSAIPKRPESEAQTIGAAVAKRARRAGKRAESQGRQQAATFDARATWELRRQHADIYGGAR